MGIAIGIADTAMTTSRLLATQEVMYWCSELFDIVRERKGPVSTVFATVFQWELNETYRIQRSLLSNKARGGVVYGQYTTAKC